MKKINLNIPVKRAVQEYPEIIDILVSVGLKNITNPAMLNTVGRFVSIKEGAKMRNVALDLIKEKLTENNFIWEE